MDNRQWVSAVWFAGALAAAAKVLAVPAAAPTTAATPWLEVSERTACEAMQDEYCLGRYGFRILSDGTFVAGGSGIARTVDGKLAPGELNELNSLIGEASANLPGAEKECRKAGLPGIRDQIDLTLAGGTVVRIYDLGGRVGQLCHLGSWHTVHRLHDYLHNLMSRYYPLPFPTH